MRNVKAYIVDSGLQSYEFYLSTPIRPKMTAYELTNNKITVNSQVIMPYI